MRLTSQNPPIFDPKPHGTTYAKSPAMGVFGKMKTLLRKIPTGLYFRAPDQWTNDPWEALDFDTIDHAQRFVQTWNLTDIEMAFAFANSGQVTTVPLERIALQYSHD
jgi:hypothetical protein